MRKTLLIVCSFGLAGCNLLPADLGRGEVDTLLIERGQAPPEQTEPIVAAGLLSLSNAVHIALVNNPAIKAEYARLGFGVADVYAAGRIRNPILSASILSANESGALSQDTFGLMTSFTDVLTRGARRRQAKAGFAALKQEVSAAVLNTAMSTQYAYYDYVAAQQIAVLRHQTAKAASLSYQLAQRFDEAGNMTPRNLALSRAAASDAQLRALEADASAYGARVELSKLMGVSAGLDWKTPTALPPPVTQSDPIETLLDLARSNRLDVAAARNQVKVIADRLGVTGWTRLLGELDIGGETERETDGVRITGPTLNWEIPAFSQNRDRLLRREAELNITIAEVQRLEIDMDNDVRLAAAAMANAKARANELRTELVPARQAATNRAQEEENFMLIGIFEVITTKQAEYDSIQSYFEALRDYWLARTELARAVGTTLPSDELISEQRIDVEAFIAPDNKATGHQHHHHYSGDSR